MNILRGFSVVVVSMLLVAGFILALTGFDFAMFRFWAPKYENVRREVFEGTYSYNRGMIQELENMQREYIQAGPEERKALGSMILHRASGYPEEMMPLDLRAFIRGLKQSQRSVQ